jgi:hypothetical protein
MLADHHAFFNLKGSMGASAVATGTATRKQQEEESREGRPKELWLHL